MIKVKKFYDQNGQNTFRGITRSISSYLLVFLIPFLTVSWIWYATSVKSINEQVALTAKNQLIQLKYSLENNFLQLNYLTQKMTDDHQLSLNFLTHPYYSKEGKASLQTYKITNEFVEEVYLYYKEEPENFFSSIGKLSVEGFLEKVIPDNDMQQGQLIDQLEKAYPTLLTIEGASLARHHSRFFYIVPLQNDELTVYGAAIYEIKEASLAKMLDLTNSDGASTNYLINDEFQILASTNHNDLTVFLNDPQEMAQITTQDTFQFNQQKYLVQSIPNEELHISVVSVTNPSQALSLVNRVQEHFILIFMCILFVGIIAVTLMGIRNYRPIRKIEHLVREFHKDMEMSVNSMDDVHNTLAAVLEEQQELHKEIQMQTPHAREQVLRKLMSGRLRSEQEVARLIEAVHIHFPADNYFVITIDTKTVASKYKAGESCFLIDYIEEISSQGYTAYATEILSTEVIALTVGFDHRYQQEEIVQEVAAKIAAAIGLLPAIGVGTIVNELTAINESYIEGLAALDYHVSNNQQIIYYLEISAEEQRSAIQYPDSQKLKLIQALNQGNSDIAIETVHWLIKDGLSKQRSQPVQKMYGYYLLNTVAQTGGELVGEEILLFAAEHADFTNLMQLGTVLQQLVQHICEKVRDRPQNQESELNETIFAYIKANFQSSQLSLESIAEEFKVSVSYISRFVKKESGKTFSKYIQELRLEKIKQELVETDLPIKEIIRDNGYYDVSNYTRKFRTIVGVTPGQYRKINQKR